MVESLPYTYTSQDEISRILSDEGVVLMVDDDNDGYLDTTTTEGDDLNEAIYEATDEINFYILEHYDASAMSTNRWVRRMASYLAANILSIRRGNGAKYQSKIEQIYQRLEQIKNSHMEVPRLVRRNKEGPAMSNLVVDHKYGQSKLRVTPGNSVGNRYSGQAGDYNWLW